MALGPRANRLKPAAYDPYHAPDLVILDVMLLGIDGLEVLRRIRSANANLPVLLLTARDEPADQVKGLEAGADD